jgi:hypothetical protein
MSPSLLNFTEPAVSPVDRLGKAVRICFNYLTLCGVQRGRCTGKTTDTLLNSSLFFSYNTSNSYSYDMTNLCREILTSVSGLARYSFTVWARRVPAVCQHISNRTVTTSDTSVIVCRREFPNMTAIYEAYWIMATPSPYISTRTVTYPALLRSISQLSSLPTR